MERFLCFFLGSLIINYWGTWNYHGLTECFPLIKAEAHFGGAFMEGTFMELLHMVGEFVRRIYDLKIQSFEL